MKLSDIHREKFKTAKHQPYLAELLKKLEINGVEPYAFGNGYIYEVGTDKMLKITNQADEAKNANKAMNIKSKHVPYIYAVEQIGDEFAILAE